jgi:hypothetical protein
MNYDAAIDAGSNCIPAVRQFCGLFENVEHTIVKAKRDLDSDGWQVVYEWISRAHLYDRYTVWLVVAINIEADGSLLELEKPCVYVVEIDESKESKDEHGRPSWELSVAELEDGDWEQLVESRGDFAAIALELTTNAPVERFATFWINTRPIPLDEPPEGMAFKAPLRYFMQ